MSWLYTMRPNFSLLWEVWILCAIGALGRLLLPSEFDALLLDLLKHNFWVLLMLLQSFNFTSGALLVFFASCFCGSSDIQPRANIVGLGPQLVVVVVVRFNRGVLMFRFWCQVGPGVSIIHTKSRHSHRDTYRSLFRLWKCQTNLQKRQGQKCFSDKLWKATHHIVDEYIKTQLLVYEMAPHKYQAE